MANLHIVIRPGADCVAEKAPSGGSAILAAGVRSGHLVLPAQPQSPAGKLRTAVAPKRRGATCGPKGTVRVSQAPRRYQDQGRPARPFGSSEPRRGNTFLVGYPDAPAIGEESCLRANLDAAELRKIHTQLWHADAAHMLRGVWPAVGPERPAQGRAKALIRQVIGSYEVCKTRGRPAPRPRRCGLLAAHPYEIVALDMVEIDVPGRADKLQCPHLVGIETKFPPPSTAFAPESGGLSSPP